MVHRIERSIMRNTNGRDILKGVKVKEPKSVVTPSSQDTDISIYSV